MAVDGRLGESGRQRRLRRAWKPTGPATAVQVPPLKSIWTDHTPRWSSANADTGNPTRSACWSKNSRTPPASLRSSPTRWERFGRSRAFPGSRSSRNLACRQTRSSPRAWCDVTWSRPREFGWVAGVAGRRENGALAAMKRVRLKRGRVAGNPPDGPESPRACRFVGRILSRWTHRGGLSRVGDDTGLFGLRRRADERRRSSDCRGPVSCSGNGIGGDASVVGRGRGTRLLRRDRRLRRFEPS